MIIASQSSVNQLAIGKTFCSSTITGAPILKSNSLQLIHKLQSVSLYRLAYASVLVDSGTGWVIPKIEGILVFLGIVAW